jgi:hypothetical protein
MLSVTSSKFSKKKVAITSNNGTRCNSVRPVAELVTEREEATHGGISPRWPHRSVSSGGTFVKSKTTSKLSSGLERVQSLSGLLRAGRMLRDVPQACPKQVCQMFSRAGNRVSDRAHDWF